MEQKNRTIRPLTQGDLEDYLDIYLNAYPAFKSLDDDCREQYRRRYSREIAEGKDVLAVGLFEDGTLIATMKLVSFSMNLYGQMQKACGLMSLAVHPLHKKKGAALDMVRYFEDYARDTGALVTLLLPFSIAFYRRMGYGFGAKLDEYRVPTVCLPKPENLDGLLLLKAEDVPQVLACHQRFAERNHGALAKFSEEVYNMESDTQVRRIGYVEDGSLKGYLAFRFEDASDVNYTQNRISVEEMVYEDGTVLRKLLGFLRLQADLAQTVVLRTGEADFYHLLEDPQDVSGNYIPYGFLQTNVSAVGTMFKVLDPAEFISATAYRKLPEETVTVRFVYEDELAHREKTVTVGFAGGHWSALEDDAEPDVTVWCRAADLSSMLLGSCGLSSMVRMGGVGVSDPALAEKVDRLLYLSRKPFSNADY